MTATPGHRRGCAFFTHPSQRLPGTVLRCTCETWADSVQSVGKAWVESLKPVVGFMLTAIAGGYAFGLGFWLAGLLTGAVR